MDTSTLLRVCVPNEKQNGWVTVDVAPPNSDETIREFIVSLVAYLRQEFIENGRKTTYLDAPETQWSLSKGSVGAILNPDTSLAESGLIDGDRVYLTHESAREEFTKVLDDTSDAVASELKNTYPEWSKEVAAQHVAKIIPVALITLSFAAVWTVLSISNIAWFVTATLSVGFTLTAILSLVYALPSIATAKHWEKKYVAGISALFTSLIAAGVAGFLAPPLPVSNWSLISAGAMIVAVGIAARATLITGAESITHGGIATGASFLIAGSVSAFTSLSLSQAFIMASLIGLISLLSSGLWALPLARVASPYVPAVGESFVRDSDKDLASLPMSAEAKAVAEIVGQVDRIHAARSILLGLRVGSITAIGLGLWGAILTYSSATPVDIRLIIGFIVSASLVIIATATSEIDEQIHSYMLWTSTVFIITLPLICAIAGGEFNNYIFPSVGIITICLIISVIFTMRGGESPSSPMLKFILELIEAALSFAPFALSLFIFDLYGIVVSI